MEKILGWFATSDFGGAACLLLIVAGTAALVTIATSSWGRKK